LKFKHSVIIVFVVLLIDQLIKIWVKTHMSMEHEIPLFGNWGKLHFIENEGMAFGLKFGGENGKLALTIFRFIAGIWGFWFINHLIKTKHHNGLIFCASLILAGALGNLIDSIFYGMIFDEGSFHGAVAAKFVPWGKGYGTLLHGRVVDMFYFPVINSVWPKWVPMIGGISFIFFSPIFNFADAAISTGVISILVFQRKLLK
jgi:signal peptidase II